MLWAVLAPVLITGTIAMERLLSAVGDAPAALVLARIALALGMLWGAAIVLLVILSALGHLVSEDSESDDQSAD
jgi:hypothetical protein